MNTCEPSFQLALLRLSYEWVALPALFLLVLISSAVILGHHAMSKHAALGHLILGSLTCIVKTVFHLSVKGKVDHVIGILIPLFLLGFSQPNKLNAFRKYNENWSFT